MTLEQEPHNPEPKNEKKYTSRKNKERVQRLKLEHRKNILLEKRAAGIPLNDADQRELSMLNEILD